MVKFREYQKEIVERGAGVMRRYGFVYLAMEVRTGKTLTSLGIAEELGAKNVLFLTKKKAISSIQDDYSVLGPSYTLEVINYESMHKVPLKKWDIIIADEAHGMGAFPKPSKRAKDLRTLINKTGAMVILLSGTPTPESYSQMYHQVYGIPMSPFRQYKNFYGFAQDNVAVKVKRIGTHDIKDFSGGTPKILDIMAPYTISYTQEEAGFLVETTENILEVPLQPLTYAIMRELRKNLVVQGKDEVILADTGVKLMIKLHQLCSGTIKFESGNSKVLDDTKARFIKHTFNLTNKNIALQIVSGREGISLQNAQALVYYNIDFSATSYWQSRDRMTTKDRLKNDVYWIFSKGGIEKDIYAAVSKKKDYTLRHFKKDLLFLQL